MTYPLLFHITDSLPDKQDPLLNLWILAWEAHQVVRSPLQLFDANIFYPFRHTLAYSETLLSTSGLVFPFMLSPSTRILGYNLAFLSTFFLTGWGTYLLVFYLSRKRAAGIIAGLIFAFAPYRFGHLSQIQLLSVQWFPFVILTFDRLLRQSWQRRQPGIDYKSLLLFATFFTAQCLASFYYAFQAALLVSLYAVVFLMVHRRHVNRMTGVHLALAALLPALIVAPLAVPYLTVQKELNAGWSLANNVTFSASLQAYLLTAGNNPLYGPTMSHLAYTYGPCCPPDTLFPGILPSLLAVLGIALWWRSRSRAAAMRQGFYALLLLLAFVLSLGPVLHLRAGQSVAEPFSLPYAWLYHTVPLFQAMRAPVRFANLVMFALAILSGWGMVQLLNRFRDRAHLWIVIATGGIILLEYVAFPITLVRIPGPDQLPPVYRWLASQPPGVILELPVANKLPTPSPASPANPRERWAASRLLEHQYFSTFHWHTTPDGYSGFIPPRHGEMVYEMAHFPSARSIALLQALDVRWLILHQSDFSAARWTDIQDALPGYPQMQYVRTFGSDTVYRVTQPGQQTSPVEADGYLPPRAKNGGVYTAYILLHLRGARPVAAKPTGRVSLRATWTDSGGRSITQFTSYTLPLVNSGAEVRPIQLSVPSQPGTYQLKIQEDSDVVPTLHLEGQVIVGKQEGRNEAPVPVRLLPPAALPDRLAPGDTLHVSLRWQALGKINEYDSAFLRLTDGNGQVLVHTDHGAGGREHPTLLWIPGEIITDTYQIPIPADAPPGTYRLEAGLYLPEGVAPRLLLDNDGHPSETVTLTSLVIGP